MEGAAEGFGCLGEAGVAGGDVFGVAVAHEAGDGEGEDIFEVVGADDGDATFVLDEEIDDAGEVFVRGADGDDVVAVVGDAGGDGAVFEADAADEGDGGWSIVVAVDDGDFEDVLRGVGDGMSIAEEGFGLAGASDDLSVEGFDDAEEDGGSWQLAVGSWGVGIGGNGRRRGRRRYSWRGWRCGDGEVGWFFGEGVEFVGAGGFGFGEEGLAVAGDALAVDPGFHDFEADEVVEANEVGGGAGAEESAAESVVLDGIDAGGAEDVEEGDAVGDGAGAELVDVALHEVVGVFVVAAEHAGFGGFVEQRPEFLEIFGGGPFADENFLSKGELFAGFVDPETFVVGLDSGSDVFFEVVAAEAGGVSVDALAVFFGGLDFLHDFGVTVDDAGEVHHFREVEEGCVAAEFLDGVGSEGGAGGFEVGGGDAGGDAEMDFAGRLRGELLHVADAVETEDVGDLVRVGDGADGAVGDGDAGELRRGEHGALDVDVGVDEAGAEVAGVGDGLVFADGGDFAVGDFDNAGENALVGDVEDLAAEEHGEGREG